MKQFFGYVWTIDGYSDDGEDVGDMNDGFVNLIEPDSSGGVKYHVKSLKPHHKTASTLGTCDDWTYDRFLYRGTERHIMRGNVPLAAGSGTHKHHILVIYPDPWHIERLTGYIVRDTNVGRTTAELLDILAAEESQNGSIMQVAGPLNHNGTYHSEN